jgi:hypothetical protein
MKFLELDEPLIPYIVMGTCGKKQAGKSLYSRELGFKIVKEEGGEILWISTEEPTDFMFTIAIDEHPGWDNVFAKKYGVEPIVHWEWCPTAEDMMRFIGVEGKVIITEASVSTPKPLKDIKGETSEDRAKREEKAKKDAEEKQKGSTLAFKTIKVDTDNSPLLKMLKEHDIRYIVVDSFTNPFDELISGGRQNFNIRAQLEESFLNTMQRLVTRYGQSVKKNTYIMTTNHITNNPTDPFTAVMIEKELHEKGGGAVGYNLKVLYGFKPKQTPHGAREVWVMRFPNLPDYGKMYNLLITDKGFVKTSAAELKVVKEEQKAERQEAKES